MENKINQQGHQGDVQFKSVQIPQNAEKIGHQPLAYGEHSGHVHVLTGDVQLFRQGENMFANVGPKGACLQHVHQSQFNNNYATADVLPKADHNPVEIQEGQYLFGIHQSYNPFKKVFERVID